MKLFMKFFVFLLFVITSLPVTALHLTIWNNTQYDIEVASSNVFVIEANEIAKIKLDPRAFYFSITATFKDKAFGRTTFIDQSQIKKGEIYDVFICDCEGKILTSKVHNKNDIKLWHIGLQKSTDASVWVRFFLKEGRFINELELQEEFYEQDHLELLKKAPPVARDLMDEFDAVAPKEVETEFCVFEPEEQ